MADSGWAIRFYHANDYSKEGTVDFISNFKNTKSRQLDTIVAFTGGMYGIDNYLIWNIHKDLPSYDFSTVALNLRLFMYKNPEIVYFQDFYRVRDVKYNPKNSQYTLYAVSETTIRLQKRLIDYNVTSLSYKENRTAEGLLKEIIQDNNIFYVIFHPDAESTKNMIHYEYRYFDINIEWTVLDLIEYIADTNKYEWCVTRTVDKDNIPYWFLHIGHELKASRLMNATIEKFNMEKDNISHSIYAMKITTNGSPMDVLANWEENLKCVWAKHTAGKAGAISRGCFIPTGMGYLDKHLYLKMLEGSIERDIAYSMLNRRKVRIPSIGIGNILTDEGNEYVDEISIQKNPHTYSITEPRSILINRGDDLAVQHQLERATRSTSYLDDGAGLLFPSPKLENPPPNSLIFNVDGKRESAVVGGYVYGNGREELRIPFKERDDFRLQFPNGWCLYVDEEGNTQLLTRDTDPTTKPDIGAEPSQEAIQIITKKEGVPSEIRLFCESDNYINIIAPLNGINNITNIANSGAVWIKGGVKVQISTGDLLQNYIVIGVTGGANPGIKILTDGSDPINIESESGTITINTTGTVNIGASASAVNIAGGANVLSHGTHTHTTPVAIPGPPQTCTPTSDNTTKTKAD